MNAQLPTIKIVLNKAKQNEAKIQLDQRVLKFGIPPFQSQDYSQPFEIPEQIANSQLPFEIVAKFAEAHGYDPGSVKIKLPISSSNYRQIVDKTTYSLCERYTNLDYANEVEEILKLAKWMQFKQLEQAVAAAVAVNYYTGFDDHQIQDFMQRNKLNELTPEQIEQIYEENKEIFNYIEQRTKEQFIKQAENGNDE